jgi:2-polyprenyl-6-methoxyphenol hydroxylase-like FAD-dependent oxidoreductase
VVLSVESSFVKTWHQPGLLLIGDAAHVMSPIGGVGINVAIQDAISAANLLTEPLRRESISSDQLATVQLQREGAVHSIQGFQTMVQNRIIKNALNAAQPFRLPLLFRILLNVPVLRNVPARMIAFGSRPSKIDDNLIHDHCNSRLF